MLAQAATAVTAATLNQPANLDLPFLSGSLSDAARASELLVAFLEENVQQPVLGPDGQPLPVQPDPAGIGRPDFASLQQLVALLEDFDAERRARRRVGRRDRRRPRRGPPAPHPEHVARGGRPGRPRPAGPGQHGHGHVRHRGHVGVGTVTTAVGAPFTDDDHRAAHRRRRLGRHRPAGLSTAAATAVLTAPWTGGEPADGTVFVLEGAAPQAGVVELGDLLGTGGPTGPALRGANGIVPSASVTPDYDVELRLALDLQAPRTGAACSDGPADAPCPYTRTNADGSSTVVVEEPVCGRAAAVRHRLPAADAPTSRSRPASTRPPRPASSRST